MPRSLLPKEIEAYTDRYTSAEPAGLAALNRQTHLKRGDAIMLSGQVQGVFLKMMSCMIQPRRILEIGTYTGYSAICLAQGLAAGGVLHTIEVDEELHDIQAAHFAKEGVQHLVVQHTGMAADIIPGLEGPFDLVFIDADKNNYSLYYDLVFGMVPIGGYILADNVLYNGEVILPTAEQSKNARAMHAYNEKVKADTRIEHILLPLRDGIMVVRKVGE